MKSGKFSGRALRVAVEALEIRKLLAGTVGGVVYEDTNGNGIRDGVEPGSAGRNVFVDLDDDLLFDAGEPSATTAAGGTYTIAGIPAGLVNLVHQLPTGSDFTSPGLGQQRLNVVDNQTTNATAFGSRTRNPRQYLDPTFGNLGETILNNVGTRDVVGIERLSTGGYAVVSMVNNAVVVNRFTAAGAIDGSFGGGSGSVAPVLPAGFIAASLDIMSDDRLVLGGRGGTANDLNVVVLRTDGQADTNFSGDGFQSVDFAGGNDIFRDVAVGPDNRIILLGTGDAGEILLARINVTGSMDVTFGNQGKAMFDLNSSADDPAAVAMQSDNKIVVAGTRTFASGRESGLVFRATTAGEADGTFSSAGSRVIDVTSGSLRLRDIAIQANDRAVVAGELPLGLLFFSRLNTIGTTDSSFGENGSRTHLASLDGFPLTASNPRLSLGSTGAIAFAADLGPGLITGPTGTRIGVGLFNTLGVPEVNYLPGGTLVQGFTGSESDATLGDLVVLGDNRVVVAGTAAASVAGGNKLGLFSTGLVQPRAVVTGNVFDDLNNNGIVDVGETGAAERVVFVDVNSDGQRNTGEPFATTDAQGNYAIADLLANNYPLRLTSPEGFVQSFPTNQRAINIALFPGQNLAGQNFGIHLIPPVIEANANGPYTVDEGGSVQLTGSATGAPITVYEWDFDYDGVTFTIDSTTQSPLFSAASLDGPLTRTVALRARSGSFPPSPIAPATLTVNNVAPTATFTNNGPINAGQTATVTFAGQNDVAAADRAAGFKYSLDIGNDGTIEIVDATTPALNIAANFTVTPGTLVVKGIIKDKDGGAREYLTNITINPGPAPGQITGLVFDDIDRDGVQDAGEVGLIGRTIYLDADNDGVFDATEQSTQTFGGGAFDMNPVAPGTYVVRQVVPAGLIQTLPANNGARNVIVVSGQNSMNVNFATATPPPGAIIRGTVYLDVDRDGVFDSGETGVAGRMVYLDMNNNSVLNAGEPSGLTNANGVYEFTGLAAGTYKIRQILPSGFVQTIPLNNFGNNATVTLGQVLENINFGTNTTLTPTGATIRGTVFLDADRDGRFDSGESGVAGRTVYLDLDNDSTLDGNERSTTTNASGVYEFASLAAGTYKIRQVLPTGFIQTTPSNNFGNNATVSGTQVVTGKNFGTATSTAPTGGTIRGTVWNDVDRDRAFDSGESGIAGRTVYIDLDNDNFKDGNEPSTVTNGSGVYEITGLAAGTYKVRQILPGGFSQTFPSNGFGNNVTLSTNQTKSGINFGSAANASRTFAATTVTPKIDSVSRSIFAEELIA